MHDEADAPVTDSDRPDWWEDGFSSEREAESAYQIEAENRAADATDPRILEMAEGADERRRLPAVPDDLSTLGCG